MNSQAERKRMLSENGLSEEQWNALAEKGSIPVLADIPVVYAKDGSGNEILSQSPGDSGSNEKGPTDETKRLNASGTIKFRTAIERRTTSYLIGLYK